MKLNTDECLLFVSGTKYEHNWGKGGDGKIWEGNQVKRLGVIIDNKLKFDSHNANISLKAKKTPSVLSRLMSLLTFDRKHFLNLNLSAVF